MNEIGTIGAVRELGEALLALTGELSKLAEQVGRLEERIVLLELDKAARRIEGN